MDDKQQQELRRFLYAAYSLQKREIISYYAGIKLHLPVFAKTLTIEKFREKGGDIDPDIILPINTEQFRLHGDASRKADKILDKMRDLRDQARAQIIAYYKNLKSQIPDEILKKTLDQFDELDYIDISKLSAVPAS